MKKVKIPISKKRLTGSFLGVTTFFNPAGYKNKLENYLIFRANAKKQGLKLLTVELAFGNRRFELKDGDADILIQLRTEKNNVLWQKEALLNIGLKNLPKDCDKIVWLDCDVIFQNNDWVGETAKLLEKYKIVQPYSLCARLPGNFSLGAIKKTNFDLWSEGFNEGQIIQGLAKCISEQGFEILNKEYTDYGHSGFAWAARREIFDKCRFYDLLILGSADLFMALSFYGVRNEISFKEYPRSMLLNQEAWRRKIFRETKSSVFFTKGTLLHLWHGDRGLRRYVKRHTILTEHRFDFNRDIRKDENGLWVWNSNKPELHRAFKHYFFIRAEQGLSIKMFNRLYFIFEKDAMKYKIYRAYHNSMGALGNSMERNLPRIYTCLKYLKDEIEDIF